jgi:CheY-like chemotaxis protein
MRPDDGRKRVWLAGFMPAIKTEAKCLIVDDDPLWVRMLRGHIENPKVVFSTSAEQALHELRSQKSFVLLITDTNMPGMNGIELLKKVRSDSELQDLPVIVLFAGVRGSNIGKEDVLEAGATMVMTKEEFLQKREDILKRWLIG